MVGSKLKNLSLVDLYNYPTVNSVSNFSGVIQELDVADLVQKHKELMEVAPRRHDRGKIFSWEVAQIPTEKKNIWQALFSMNAGMERLFFCPAIVS